MRFTESEYTNPSQMDFVPRERRGQLRHTIGAFALALILIFISSLGFAKDNTLAALIAPTGIVVLLCAYVVLRKQQNLDLVMSTEYQNMLFAQAAALGYNFCLFTRRDGTIIYANRGLSESIPQASPTEAAMLNTLLARTNAGEAERSRILNAVYNAQNERVIIALTDKKGAVQDYVWTVEPLSRPGEFVVIRGREFRDARAGLQVMPEALRSTPPEKLDFLLTKSPVAMYITDQYGEFEYVNPSFEALLGYAAGEITAHRLSLQHILYQIGTDKIGEEYTPADFRGEALMRMKGDRLANVRLSQSVMRDEAGKVRSATGSALPIGNAPKPA